MKHLCILLWTWRGGYARYPLRVVYNGSPASACEWIVPGTGNP